MVDLGKYAPEVLSAYAVTLALLALLVGVSVWRARRVRRALERMQERHRKDG